MAARVNALEGGVGAHLVSSGIAAETLTFLTLGQAGSNIVASPSLYGGTTNLLTHTLPKFGITTRFVEDPADPASRCRRRPRPGHPAGGGQHHCLPLPDPAH